MSIRSRCLRYLRAADAAEKMAANASLSKGSYLRISQHWKLLAKLAENISAAVRFPRLGNYYRHRQSEFGRRRARIELEAGKAKEHGVRVACSEIAIQWRVLERSCEKLSKRLNNSRAKPACSPADSPAAHIRRWLQITRRGSQGLDQRGLSAWKQ